MLNSHYSVPITEYAPRAAGCLDVEPELDHVVGTHHVGLALRPDEARGTGRLPGSGLDEPLVADHLGGDEAPLEVGVDNPRRFGGSGAAADRPRPRLLGAGGEEALQTQGSIRGADHMVEAGLFETGRLEQLVAVRGIEPGELGLELGVDEERLRRR